MNGTLCSWDLGLDGEAKDLAEEVLQKWVFANYKDWIDLVGKDFDSFDDKLEGSSTRGEERGKQEWIRFGKYFDELKVDVDVSRDEVKEMNLLVEDHFEQFYGEQIFFNVFGLDKLHNELRGVGFTWTTEKFNFEVLAKARSEDKEVLMHVLYEYSTLLSKKKNLRKRRAEQSRMNGNPNLQTAFLHAQVCVCLAQMQLSGLCCLTVAFFSIDPREWKRIWAASVRDVLMGKGWI